MAKLLPIGTYIRVVEPGEYARPPYVDVIVGYDMGRTKYELGLRYGGWGEWLFLKGGSWTFPSWTTEITEAEAKLIPQRPIADVSGDPINVAALNALCDAATPGPWEIADEVDGWRRGRRTVVKAGVPGGASRKRVVTVDQTRDHHDKDAEDNVAFIAAARTALPALLAEVERLQAALIATRKPAPDPEHPERSCWRCGGPNIAWSAPSPLWNQVMRGGDINGSEIHHGIVCPTCFAILAERAGIAGLWKLRAERVHVPLQTVTPSGRVWNDELCMWTDLPAPAAVNDVNSEVCACGGLDGTHTVRGCEATA